MAGFYLCLLPTTPYCVQLYIAIQLHARNIKPVFLFWRPFHKCCVRIRRGLDPKSSIVTCYLWCPLRFHTWATPLQHLYELHLENSGVTQHMPSPRVGGKTRKWKNTETGTGTETGTENAVQCTFHCTIF